MHTTPHLLQKPSYAAALALGVQHTSPDTGPCPCPPQPHPAKRYNITLTQKSHDKPVFANISNCKLVVKILDTLQSAGCEYNSRLCSLDSCGNVVETWYTPGIKAAGCHRSRDIWVVTATEAECGVLVKSIDSWLPKLSEQLSYVPKTYPILVHSVLASFDTSREGKDIADLIQQNTDAITHPPTL